MAAFGFNQDSFHNTVKNTTVKKDSNNTINNNNDLNKQPIKSLNNSFGFNSIDINHKVLTKTEVDSLGDDNPDNIIEHVSQSINNNAINTNTVNTASNNALKNFTNEKLSMIDDISNKTKSFNNVNTNLNNSNISSNNPLGRKPVSNGFDLSSISNINKNTNNNTNSNNSHTSNNNSSKAFNPLAEQNQSNNVDDEHTTPNFSDNNDGLDGLSNYEKTKLEFKALKEKVKYIRLEEIAMLIGASNKEDKIKNKWKMPWGHNVSIKGQRWFNHNHDSSLKGGSNAISFAKYIVSQEEGINIDESPSKSWEAEKKGVAWLADCFGESIDKSDILAAKDTLSDEKVKIAYRSPKQLDKYLPNVIQFLTEERKIPLWMVQKQIDAGKLFAGLPVNFEEFYREETFGKRTKQKRDLNNLNDNEIYCIFKSGDAKIGAAECRCIANENQLGFTKGFSEGSHKKQSGFIVVGQEGYDQKEIAFVEGAIDAMSYQVLYPWTHSISMGGTDNSDLIINSLIEIIDNPIYNAVLALDNDKAGEHACDYIIKTLKEKIGEDKVNECFASGKIFRKIPERKKDWNEYLADLTEAELRTHYDSIGVTDPSLSIPKKKTKAKSTKAKKDTDTTINDATTTESTTNELTNNDLNNSAETELNKETVITTAPSTTEIITNELTNSDLNNSVETESNKETAIIDVPSTTEQSTIESKNIVTESNIIVEESLINEETPVSLIVENKEVVSNTDNIVNEEKINKDIDPKIIKDIAQEQKIMKNNSNNYSPYSSFSFPINSNNKKVNNVKEVVNSKPVKNDNNNVLPSSTTTNTSKSFTQENQGSDKENETTTNNTVIVKNTSSYKPFNFTNFFENNLNNSNIRKPK